MRGDDDEEEEVVEVNKRSTGPAHAIEDDEILRRSMRKEPKESKG